MTLQQLRYVIQAADSRSMNEAAKALYISQPSLSGAIKELEKEIGIELFKRSSHGTVLTPEGEEFLGYARQVTDQYQLLENRYVYRTKGKKKFSVSMQHYSFAVKAFVELVKQFGMDEYEFAVYETRTYDVLMDVKNFKSELGILYRNDFNVKVLNKLMKDNNLEFHDLFSCGTYVYLWKDHPLAERERIPFAELNRYPVIGYDKDSWMGTRTRALYAKYNIQPDIIVECPDEYSIVALVRESFGIALMPRTDILELAPGVCIHPIENLDIYHQIFMFWMKERYRLPAVERFIEYMKQQARQDGLQAERETDSKNVLKIYLKDIVNF